MRLDRANEARQVVCGLLGGFGTMPAYLVYRTVSTHFRHDNKKAGKSTVSSTNAALDQLVAEGAVRVHDGHKKVAVPKRTAKHGTAALPDNVLVSPCVPMEPMKATPLLGAYVYSMLRAHGHAIDKAGLRELVCRRMDRWVDISNVVDRLASKGLIHKATIGHKVYVWPLEVGGAEYWKTEAFMEDVA